MTVLVILFNELFPANKEEFSKTERVFSKSIVVLITNTIMIFHQNHKQGFKLQDQVLTKVPSIV